MVLLKTKTLKNLNGRIWLPNPCLLVRVVVKLCLAEYCMFGLGSTTQMCIQTRLKLEPSFEDLFELCSPGSRVRAWLEHCKGPEPIPQSSARLARARDIFIINSELRIWKLKIWQILIFNSCIKLGLLCTSYLDLQTQALGSIFRGILLWDYFAPFWCGTCEKRINL